MSFALAALTPLLAALCWSAILVADPGRLSPASTLLIGTGLIVPTTVGGVGMIVTGARWAWRLSVGATAASLVAALVLPYGRLWLLALSVTTLAAIAILSPPARSGLRRLPAATGPPTRAVLLPLVLLLVPFILGVASPIRAGAVELLLGLSAPLAALWYARVFPGGLLVARFGWPALALVATPFLDPAALIATLVSAGVVALLAWHPEVKTAFHPPYQRGSAYPIPPELTPPDIRGQAGIDDKGRRR